jgi:hypothetical protein
MEFTNQANIGDIGGPDAEGFWGGMPECELGMAQALKSVLSHPGSHATGVATAG